MALSDSIERLPFNDALVNEAGHHIELIDPGFPHEPCFCVRLGATIYFMSPTTHFAQVQAVIDFLDTFEWAALGLPKPDGRWHGVMSGASDNPLWDRPLGILSLPDYQLLVKPSGQTGALKTQMRVKRRKTQRADSGDDKIIQFVSSTCRRGSRTTTEAQFAVNRCYKPTSRQSQADSGIVRIEAIRQATLDEMTLADLYAEGYREWNDFYRYWRKDDGTLRLNIPIWCFNLAPVFTKPQEFKISDFRPIFVLPPTSAMPPRQLAMAGF